VKNVCLCFCGDMCYIHYTASWSHVKYCGIASCIDETACRRSTYWCRLESTTMYLRIYCATYHNATDAALETVKSSTTIKDVSVVFWCFDCTGCHSNTRSHLTDFTVGCDRSNSQQLWCSVSNMRCISRSIVVRPSLGGRIKCCTPSVCLSVCLSLRPVPMIFSK